MSGEIINYYKELYSSNPKRNSLNNENLKDKIKTIIDILLELTDNENGLWPTKSYSYDYNGFSQKIIAKIIKDDNIKKEIFKFNYLLSIICQEENNSNLFLHTISRSVLFKKKENIKGGSDIRVINILPAWLIILEKLSYSTIKKLLIPKINMIQFGFIGEGDCNIAKVLVWYNANQKGYNKHLLIDIKKAFDSINRNKLREMLSQDFKGKELALLTGFIDIYDTIEINMIDERIYPTKGGPQGSSIVPIMFCYYLNKGIQNINLKPNITLQAYADDTIVQSNNLNDLQNTYNKIKLSLLKYDLVLNPEKCDILSDNKTNYIIDESTGISINSNNIVKYLGQKIDNMGVSADMIENKLFGNLKNKLNKLKFLTRYTRIRIFKTYMITKINYLFPLICLNGHIEESWKCIRRIIFRDVLLMQTTPLETLITLGIGYYNLMIKPLLKLIDKYAKFSKETTHIEILKNASIKAIIFWKSLERKLPDKIEKAINNMIELK